MVYLNNKTKFAMAGQASNIHQYENTKRKAFNCNANVFFNQQCIKRDLLIVRNFAVQVKAFDLNNVFSTIPPLLPNIFLLLVFPLCLFL